MRSKGRRVADEVGKLCNILWGLSAVQLYDVEGVFLDLLHHFGHVGIDEHTDALGLNGQIRRPFGHIPTTAWPEDEAHPIYTQSLHCTDVFGIAHTANLN